MTEQHIVDTYLSNGDWRMKENANHIFCVGHMMNYLSNKFIYDYWMNTVFTPKIKEFHEKGRIYCHDLSRLTPYCTGFSTSEVIKYGLKGPKGRIDSKPPKHLCSAINQLTNFVGVLSQEFAGAIALNDFSLFLAPFVRYDELDYKGVKQEIQQFVFHMNQPNRWSAECPFTNVTINLAVPEDLKNKKIMIGGEEKSAVYGDFEKEMNMINEALLEVLIEGDANGTPMTFPVLTIGVTEDFPWDSEIAKKIFQVTAKYGTPFFENFHSGTGRDPKDSRSLCCRLNLNKAELRKHTGGLFGSSDSMGSIAVTTVNLNRIGYEAKTEEEYFKLLEITMDVCRDALELRRNKINEMYTAGLYPYTMLYLKNYRNYFSTIGVIGGNESMLNFMKKTLSEPEALTFIEKVLDFMNEKCKQYQLETGNLYNLEAVPGEGACYAIARKDREEYPDIILAGTKEPFLTNSTLPPVDEIDFLHVVKTQEPLQIKYSGGTTLNIYLGEKMDTYIQAKNLVKKIIENTKIPYFSIVPTYAICKECGYIEGEIYSCPKCNKKTEVFSRVVGYLKPIQRWNNGKREEFRKRKYFLISEMNKIGTEEPTKVEQCVPCT